MPPRPSIDSDDEIVADLLAATLDLLIEAGGWVDPRVVLVAREGQLSLHADLADGSPLMLVPRAAMVRVDAVTWADDDEQLAVAGLPDDLGDIELQMLFVQLALHNQAGKLGHLRATHPALAPDLPDGFTDAVRRFVPSFRTTSVTARDLLWANRCFRLPVDDTHPRVLVPVVDLLNHHSQGAAGQWDGTGFSVTAERPFGTSECALDYGMGRDALEMAVVYGFADRSSPIARSAPVTVTVPTGETLTIAGAGRSPDGTWLPVQADADDHGVTVSHLTFAIDEPDRPVRELMRATGWTSERSATAAEAVRSANIDLLDQVIDDTADSSAVRTIVAAARHQRSILDGSLTSG